ncbi:MAG: hypothetical protein O9272_08310 [Brevundimonas sp.]|jgi:hypothetical protein|nr:hypothetical protein [Brevundimonas sp.]
MSPEVFERAEWTPLDNIALLASTSSMTLRDPYVRRAQQKGGAKEALARGWMSVCLTSRFCSQDLNQLQQIDAIHRLMGFAQPNVSTLALLE